MSGNGPFDDDDDDQEELFFGYPAAAPAPSSSSNPTHNNVNAGIDEFPEVLGGLLDLKYLQKLEEEITPRTERPSASTVTGPQNNTPTETRLTGVRKLNNSFYVRVYIQNMLIYCSFPTLEQAALAYLYIKDKDANSPETGYDGARDSFARIVEKHDYYKKLYPKLKSALDAYKARGINLVAQIEGAIGVARAKAARAGNISDGAAASIHQQNQKNTIEPDIIELENGFSVLVRIEGMPVYCKFDTKEQAALAFLSIQDKLANSSQTGSEEARNNLAIIIEENDYYKTLYPKLKLCLEEYKARGIDLEAMIDLAVMKALAIKEAVAVKEDSGAAASAIVHSPMDPNLLPPGIMQRTTGFSLITSIGGMRITLNFTTLEKAALACLYARRKYAYSPTTGSYNARKDLSRTLENHAGLRRLYATLDASLDRHQAEGVNIRKIMDDAMDEAVSRRNSGKPPPLASKRLR